MKRNRALILLGMVGLAGTDVIYYWRGQPVSPEIYWPIRIALMLLACLLLFGERYWKLMNMKPLLRLNRIPLLITYALVVAWLIAMYIYFVRPSIGIGRQVHETYATSQQKQKSQLQ